LGAMRDCIVYHGGCFDLSGPFKEIADTASADETRIADSGASCSTKITSAECQGAKMAHKSASAAVTPESDALGTDTELLSKRVDEGGETTTV
jgi:hypothetical protein